MKSPLSDRMGIRGRLIILALGISLGSLLVLTLIQTRVTQNVLVEREARLLASAAQLTANALDDFIAKGLDNVRSDAQDEALARFLAMPSDVRGKSSDRVEVEQLLERGALRDSIFVASYALLDARGRNVADSNHPNLDGDESAHGYFQAPVRDGLPHVSEIEPIAPGSKRLVLTFSAVVRDAEFRIVGVLRLRYYAQVLQRLVARDTGLLGPGAFLTLIDQTERYLAHGLQPRVVGRSAELDAPELSRGLRELGDAPMFTTHLQLGAYGGGEEQKVARCKLQRKPWQIAVVRSSEAFIAPVQEQLTSAGLVALGVAACAVLAAVFFGTRVAAPILRLTESAERVARGDLESHARISGPREVQALAHAFNLMTDQVRETLDGLLVEIGDRTRAESAARESEERVRAFVENALDVILVIDKQGQVMYASPSIERLLGRTAAAVLGENWFDWLAPADAPAARARLSEAVAENKPVFDQLRVLHRDGKQRDV